MKNYFKNVEEHEICAIQFMCKAIELKKLHIVCTNANYKMLVSDGNYTYDYTYNLCRFGFAKVSRKSKHLAMLHKYCPYQDVAQSLSAFLNTAVELGYYVRTTKEKFDGGQDFQFIWML